MSQISERLGVCMDSNLALGKKTYRSHLDTGRKIRMKSLQQHKIQLWKETHYENLPYDASYCFLKWKTSTYSQTSATHNNSDNEHKNACFTHNNSNFCSIHVMRLRGNDDNSQTPHIPSCNLSTKLNVKQRGLRVYGNSKLHSKQFRKVI